MEFRCDNSTRQWHCCTNCSQWPEQSFDIVWMEHLPSAFALCDECKNLTEGARCTDELLVDLVAGIGH